jgi:hypothetical protein
MYSTACHRQEHQLKDKPQQAAENQQTESQNISPTLKLPCGGFNRLEKKIKYKLSRRTR